MPWQGGALYVPGISWPQAEARGLAGELIAWHLYCDLRGDRGCQNQIHNNLRSINLARAAGYRSPGWNGNTPTAAWLQAWGALVGQPALRKMLQRQGADDKPAYQSLGRQR